tara:strand:- start:162 stop:599 length:438 start_codon:yes stop_codon:yes gene_type:complete
MQFTVGEIKQMIKEELEVILTNEEVGEIFGIGVQQQLEEGSDEEGSMAVGQLGRLAEMVDEVRSMIDEADDLDEWVEAKITKAHDYINTVLNYLSGADDDFDPDVDPGEPALELPQVDRDTLRRMQGIGQRKANPRLRFKENNTK